MTPAQRKDDILHAELPPTLPLMALRSTIVYPLGTIAVRRGPIGDDPAFAALPLRPSVVPWLKASDNDWALAGSASVAMRGRASQGFIMMLAAV